VKEYMKEIDKDKNGVLIIEELLAVYMDEQTSPGGEVNPY